MNRRKFLSGTAASFAATILSRGVSTLAYSTPSPARRAGKPIPVVFDTDIGDDIDDTWALAFLLASPELETRLVVTDSNDTVGKAKIAAKFLEIAGRTDVPVGIGKPFDGKMKTSVPFSSFSSPFTLQQPPCQEVRGRSQVRRTDPASSSD